MGSWVDDAACRHVLHYFEVGDEVAFRTCAGCAVKTQCADFAISNPRVTEGIWGGLRFHNGTYTTIPPPGWSEESYWM